MLLIDLRFFVLLCVCLFVCFFVLLCICFSVCLFVYRCNKQSHTRVLNLRHDESTFSFFMFIFFIPLDFFLRLCRISVRCCLAQFLPSYFIFVGYRFLPSLFLPLFHSVSLLLRFPLGHFHFGPLATSKYCLLPVAFFSWHLHPQAEVAFPSSPRPFAYCTPLHSRMMVEGEGIVGREGVSIFVTNSMRDF